MPSVTLQADKSALIKEAAPLANFSAGTNEVLCDSSMYKSYLLCAFAAMASALQHKKITAVTAYAYLTPAAPYCAPVVESLTGDFDQGTVTLNNAPGATDTSYGDSVFSAGYAGARMHSIECAKHGVRIGANYWCSVQTSRGSNPPYLQISYDDEDVTGAPANCTPAGGYVPKGKATTFAWDIMATGWCYGDITQAAATFRWRTGEGAAATEIACGTARQCTVPAGTFAADSLQWQVSITDNTGAVSTSDWYTLSTVEAASTAAITAPRDDIIDGTQPCTVSWQHVISTGTAPTGYELQQSADGSVWTALAADMASAATSCTVPAGALGSGDLYLRVRTYNQDGAAGAWSDAAHNIVVAAPAAPIVTTDGTARPTVHWQASSQQGCEVRIDGQSSGTIYGTMSSYKWPAYLADGQHTAYVRVQNRYGLWSDWGAATFTAAHTEGAAISLVAAAAHRVSLGWTTAGAYTAYWIYRDGVKIAETTAKSYIDNLSIGSCSYQVRGVYSDSDDYGLSGKVTARVICDTVMIGDAETGEWMELRRTAKSDRTVTRSYSADVSYTYYSGAEYPAAEISGFKARTYAFDAAFTAAEAAAMAQFERLLGRVVIIKDGWDNMVVGVMEAQPRACGVFLAEYSCTVRQINPT